MPSYAAFLRGVSPMNLKMPALKACLESAGFTDVRTLLSSGNAIFTARATKAEALQRKIEAAMETELGRTFMTLVRPVDELRALIEAHPYSGFELPPQSKRVVTFLRAPPKGKLKLPISL